MKIAFDTVYLANQSNSIISEWNTQVLLSGSPDQAANSIDDMFVLPPIQGQLEVSFDLRLNDSGLEHSLAQQLFVALKQCERFWHNLCYKPEFTINQSTLCVLLNCSIFTLMKFNTLFEQPMSSQSHRQLQIETVTKLCVRADFHSNSHVGAQEITEQCNSYLASLFISQLEFQFPLVFSFEGRNRFLAHEKSLGPVSYALTNSSAMILKLIKMLSLDMTATTSYQLTALSLNRNRKQRIIKKQESESVIIQFEIFKHSYTCI